MAEPLRLTVRAARVRRRRGGRAGDEPPAHAARPPERARPHAGCLRPGRPPLCGLAVGDRSGGARDRPRRPPRPARRQLPHRSRAARWPRTRRVAAGSRRACASWPTGSPTWQAARAIAPPARRRRSSARGRPPARHRRPALGAGGRRRDRRTANRRERPHDLRRRRRRAGRGRRCGRGPGSSASPPRRRRRERRWDYPGRRADQVIRGRTPAVDAASRELPKAAHRSPETNGPARRAATWASGAPRDSGPAAYASPTSSRTRGAPSSPRRLRKPI
jgi:hypothetical protein